LQSLFEDARYRRLSESQNWAFTYNGNVDELPSAEDGRALQADTIFPTHERSR